MLPQISFLDGGFILPQAERLLIPVEVTNVKAVQLKIFEIYSSNIGQFLQGAPRNWQSDYTNHFRPGCGRGNGTEGAASHARQARREGVDACWGSDMTIS